ncbi:hypothetical protein pb186bvf_012832 [Paramecium bursaria]
MIIFVLISIIDALELSLSNQCECSELVNPNDCDSAGCLWKDVCTDYNCTSIPDQKSCNEALRCAYYQGQCSDYVSCVAYSGVYEYQCRQFGCTISSTPYQSAYQCADPALEMIECSSYLDKDNCLSFGQGACSFDKICRGTICSDMKTQDKCNIIYSGNFISPHLCLWTNNQCISANNTSFLNEGNCMNETLFTYHWSSNCTLCSDKSGQPLDGLLVIIYASLLVSI